MSDDRDKRIPTDDDGNVICPKCGEQVESITTAKDPFAAEIYGVETDMTACEECFYQRRMDF